MEVPIPATDDHCRIKILVKQLGRKDNVTFNKVFKRLSRINLVEIGDNPARFIRPTFIRQPNQDLLQFGELQNHRKIFGFIGVVCLGSASSEADALAALGAARANYDQIKADYHDTLVNNRCVSFGFPDLCATFFPSAELSAHSALDDSAQLEAHVKDLLRTIFYVLESRRLDCAFEKLDQVPNCPVLAQEERYRAGLENRTTKQYRRKCVGRLRKQCADYAMLTGQFAHALEVYHSAIDPLKSAGDLLWLAAAYEGWAAAAVAARYGQELDQAVEKSQIQRTCSMLPSQMNENNEKSQHILGAKLGHQRYRSDEAASPSTAANDSTDCPSTANNSTPTANNFNNSASSSHSSQSSRKPFQKALAILNLDRNTDPAQVDHKVMIEKLKLALENYERFSFVAYVEFECVIRAVNIYRMQRLYIDTETFLRERVGKYLADTFTLFSNQTKAHICLICAAIYKSMNFRRKNAFFSRLAVLFRLHVDDDEFRSENDYKQVYPILYSTLPGYGIDDSLKASIAKSGHVAVQVKALHEVFMSAQRAGLIEAAVRHLCYIIQTYFFHIDDTNKLQMIAELKRLVKAYTKGRLSLATPIALDQCAVILPPIQMTKFPVLTNFRIQPLPANLAPTISNANKEGDVFIYSPFQDKHRVKNVLWVVNTGCQVSVRVENVLPTELVVSNLTLHAEGCAFEPVPVRLNLAPSNGPQMGPNGHELDQQAAGEVMLLGVPREPGLLTLTGYSCEVFDVENVCALREAGELRPITVRVIQSLPRLQVSTSLKRAPVLDESSSGGIAEATVFSGQTFIHSITLQNLSKTDGIRSIRVQINQPKVLGGPSLLEFLDLDKYRQQPDNPYPTAQPLNQWNLPGLGPEQTTELSFRIFGIDPSATALDNKEKSNEQQVFIRKHNPKRPSDLSLLTSTTTTTASTQPMDESVFRDEAASTTSSPTTTTTTTPSNKVTNSLKAIYDDDISDEEEPLDENKRLLLRNESTASAELPEISTKVRPKNSTHDLIPYTGRLLTAEFVFTYVAEVESENGETYERTESLKLAITIVPALSVTDWQILAGDAPTNRFVVVDVSNLTDSDAELTFGHDQRMITVQPKELCRVPLLCPCSSEIRAADFQQAAQRASHMMQMQEMELLRRRLELHIASHLDIRWKISALQLDGLVPVGPMLASVAFLKQLVVPTVSVLTHVNHKPYLSEDDLPACVGQMQTLQVELMSAANEAKPLKGEIQLHCFQDTQTGGDPIDRTDFLVVCGLRKQPFHMKKEHKSLADQVKHQLRHQKSASDSDLALVSPTKSRQPPDPAHFHRFRAQFSFLFRSEGVFKVRPRVEMHPECSKFADELIVPTISFNVKTKR